MAGSQGKHIKQLSKYSATTINHTSNGIVSLCWHLLATSHKYVLLGQTSTNPLEREFSKHCQGSSDINIINVQQFVEKLHIKQTSLLLKQYVNIDVFDIKPHHQCTSCDYKVGEEGSEIFDNLENLEPSLSDEIKMALMYIAWYITRNDINPVNKKPIFIMKSMEHIAVQLTMTN